MIQIRIKSKQCYGGYWVATIFHTRNECLRLGHTIVNIEDLTEESKGCYVESIEGYLVPVLKVVKVRLETWIYFPRMRHNKKKKFSYNIELVQGERYRLTAHERLYAVKLAAGGSIHEALQEVYPNKVKGYYKATIKRLFNTADFNEFLFTTMSDTLKAELEKRGITKGTIADKIAEFITGTRLNEETGEMVSVRVPQNLALWALNKASDVLEKKDHTVEQQPGANNFFVLQQQLMMQKVGAIESPNHTLSLDADGQDSGTVVHRLAASSEEEEAFDV